MLEIVVREDGKEVANHELEAVVMAGEKDDKGFVSMAGDISVVRLAGFIAHLENNAVASIERDLVPFLAKQQNVTDEEEIAKIRRGAVEDFYRFLKDIREDIAKGKNVTPIR